LGLGTMALITPKPLRRETVLANDQEFLECLAEHMLWLAVEDYRDGEGKQCTCSWKCTDRKKCAIRWFFEDAPGTLTFREACAILKLRPEEFLLHLEEFMVALRHRIVAPGDQYAGIMSWAFLLAVRRGFRKAWSKQLDVLDWHHRHKVAGKRSNERNGYFRRPR
jgi:hypothetical protein